LVWQQREWDQISQSLDDQKSSSKVNAGKTTSKPLVMRLTPLKIDEL
jgi:hypothetical protein